MIVGYLQKSGATMVVLGTSRESMIGFARIRPGDKWNPVLGIAVALLKAEPGGVRDPQEKRASDLLLSRTNTSLGSLKRFEMTDEAVLVWARLWHEYRVALKHVAERQEDGHLPGATSFYKAVNQFKKLPSDGQLAEHFGLRLIKQAGEPLFT